MMFFECRFFFGGVLRCICGAGFQTLDCPLKIMAFYLW